MGFNKVYKTLQEVFPQVDSRVLRAVAIEHSKDADAAVEVVLAEVIPYMQKFPPLSSSTRSMFKPSEDASGIGSLDDSVLMYVGGSEQNDSSIYGSTFGANAGEPDSVAHADAGHYHLTAEGIGDHIEVNGECASEETIAIESSQETNTVGVSGQTAITTLEDLNAVPIHTFNPLHATFEASEELSSLDNNASGVQEDSDEGKSNVSLSQVASSGVQDMMFTPEGRDELIVVPDMLNSDPENPEPSSSVNTASKEDDIGEMVDIEDNSTLHTMVTRSGQICSIDLLQGIIEDARSNKSTLFSAMESVISLMREVELQERATEEAKEMAAKGGLDMLSSVEDLRKMLQHAKDANDMHAGEVYGERAILATEVRELQSRLLSLSDERDKSLAILDEMHETLALRLEVAEKERKVAEKEKLEKEESARKLLAEQELIMEKVVQESNMLKQEAEENAKLREFLVDRGRVVDMLQGEISVICQDVKSLKDKFDEGIPLSKSVSSVHTSCVLASSSSSLKSITSDEAILDRDQSLSVEDQKTNSITNSTISEVKHQPSGESPTTEDVHKALVDEGWEIFENADFM